MKTTFTLIFLCLFSLTLPFARGNGSEDGTVRGPSPVERKQVEQERKEGEAGYRMVLTIHDVEYAFRWCPPGTFTMGSPVSEEGRHSNETQHQVTLTQGFWMLETEVTLGMWESVMGSNPSAFIGGKLPVETVSWNDCQEFVQKLIGLDVAPAGYRFSLPTEAQWEYACRAGTETPFHFGDAIDRDTVNFGRNLGRSTGVGVYPANAWGLRDMHGNVWEWCLDLSSDYPLGNVTDPVGDSSDTNRVLRGGGWFHTAEDCRSAMRRNREPSVRNNAIGLRLALIRVE